MSLCVTSCHFARFAQLGQPFVCAGEVFGHLPQMVLGIAKLLAVERFRKSSYTLTPTIERVLAYNEPLFIQPALGNKLSHVLHMPSTART